MEIARRPRMFFEEDIRAVHVTFDDGQRCRRNLPWSHYQGAEWHYADPGVIRLEIGDWQVVISGHNLAPLLTAVENARLAQVRAYPEFADDPAHEVDVFATSIRFIHLASAAPKR